jgi:hypothetical protein
MRNYILIFVFIAAAFISCKKDNSENTEIFGTWKWVNQTNDSWPPVDVTPQSTGINESVTFNSNHNYSIVRNGNLAETGKFSTAPFTTSSGKTSSKIIFKRESGMDSVHYFQVSGSSLSFSFNYSGANGASTRFYEKQ